ncbi:HyaD/HybD family hydrogenase maturation endopeptidase [Malaciobacter mytili]|uniref:Hydrogenase expression/formation protein n=1 Tax=Malaciobacter mytili LMG 24559 TaxID=1032238 RepID=A0AAX2ALL0_9BACT|nr:HyaD/HybD family hydrogenase maturation endopeptidase [Malaciobacter mytili]AXH14803.1 [Ni-Fe] hydrogenase maturation protease [Malaciobacter mytili LMG 24559]RXI44145.1 hydrogenase expression/formation protein [Malaciobacter mytili]RXK16826.1 hydrogenase expression/formation protein [Malaciobacter mytili LMG 24559]
MNILILGIGNILFQDEGMGAHFIHYLDEKYEFTSEENSVSIVDGGTLAHRLIPLIVKYDYIIVIDCIDALNSKAGDVYFFDFENTPKEIDWQGSAHEIEMLQTLNMIKMNGDLPNTKVLGIIPKRVADDTTFELSQEVIIATSTMEHTIIEHLKDLNITCNIKNKDVTITDIAEVSYKREIINGPKI